MASGNCRTASRSSRARHALHTAGKREACVTGANCAGGVSNSVKPRSAKAVDCRPRHGVAQPGKQCCHSRNISIVFAGLIGGAKNNVIQSAPVRPGMPLSQRGQRNCSQIIRSNPGQHSAEPTDWCAQAAADECIGHHLFAIRVMVGTHAGPGITDQATQQGWFERPRIDIGICQREIDGPIDATLRHAEVAQRDGNSSTVSDVVNAAGNPGAANCTFDSFDGVGRCRGVVGEGVRQDDRVRLGMREVERAAQHVAKRMMESYACLIEAYGAQPRTVKSVAACFGVAWRIARWWAARDKA
jgi:hypothetical protein